MSEAKRRENRHDRWIVIGVNLIALGLILQAAALFFR